MLLNSAIYHLNIRKPLKIGGGGGGGRRTRGRRGGVTANQAHRKERRIKYEIKKNRKFSHTKAVFLNRLVAARYRTLASIIPGRERPEETTICYKISLVQSITNLNVILYLSTCHTVYISVLILFMIMT